jgi:hypothetical protein
MRRDGNQYQRRLDLSAILFYALSNALTQSVAS